MCYECSTQPVVGRPVSTTDPWLRSFIAHDVFYHPYFADCQTALHVACQQAGVALCTSFEYTSTFNQGVGSYTGTVNGTADNNGVVAWGAATWAGQTWGRGDGSLDGNGYPTVNATYNATGRSQVLTNVAPKLQGWHDWASVANVFPASASPTIKMKRWFPGLSR
jgi:hypothetical protein